MKWLSRGFNAFGLGKRLPVSHEIHPRRQGRCTNEIPHGHRGQRFLDD